MVNTTSQCDDIIDDYGLKGAFCKLSGHCGVAGVTAEKESASYVFLALRALQHRGQESAGIATSVDNQIECFRGMGLVHEVFNTQRLATFKGTSCIGHIRYSTTGASELKNAQPVVASSSIGDLAIAHNGDIVNAGKFRDELREKGWAFFTTTDSEVMIRLLANELVNTGGDIFHALQNLMRVIIGSYSIVLLVGGKVLAVRDPLGIKPLCIGKLNDCKGYVVTSESVAFDAINATFIRDVAPGEIVELGMNRYKSYRNFSGTVAPNTHSACAHCMFEWVYFARPDSIIDGVSVYEVRNKIGKKLAEEHRVDADVIIPIPDSGRAHAVGYSEGTGIPFREGLIKNRYVARTFIMPEPSMRETEVKLKLNPIKSVIEGKRVVLMDDSIVRGTTMRRIVQMVRNAGAREVHVRIGCPPIISPCYLGIDMKTRSQFIAKPSDSKRQDYTRVAKMIGADSLAHISIEGLVECIGIPKGNLCLGCLTEKYPVEIPGERTR
jgi:amidophosphoribosyltransferase